MDTIRAILLAVRDAENVVNQVDGIDRQAFLFHAQLLIEAGLVVGKMLESHGTANQVVLFRLTWQGHDFADATADKTVWDKAKGKIMGPSISWTFDILREVVAGIIKDGLNL